MALIKCPECGKEVSDKAKQCIHCGYPIHEEENTTCIINGIKYDLSFILNKNYSLAYKVRDFHQISHANLSDSKKIVEKIISENKIPKTLFVSVEKTEGTKPKCPHCHSTNISPIGTGERMGSVMMLGLFSKKINKSFKCKNCKYTW